MSHFCLHCQIPEHRVSHRNRFIMYCFTLLRFYKTRILIFAPTLPHLIPIVPSNIGFKKYVLTPAGLLAPTVYSKLIITLNNTSMSKTLLPKSLLYDHSKTLNVCRSSLASPISNCPHLVLCSRTVQKIGLLLWS